MFYNQPAAYTGHDVSVKLVCSIIYNQPAAYTAQSCVDISICKKMNHFPVISECGYKRDRSITCCPDPRSYNTEVLLQVHDDHIP